MSLSNSLMAYRDCIELFDRALADSAGARMRCRNIDEAYNLRARLHYCRKLHRDENSKVYELGQPMHGRSEYDGIIVRIRSTSDAVYIYLEKNERPSGEIEALSEAEPLEEVPMKLSVEVRPQLEYKPTTTIKRRV